MLKFHLSFGKVSVAVVAGADACCSVLCWKLYSLVSKCLKVFPSNSSTSDARYLQKAVHPAFAQKIMTACFSSM